MSREVGVRIHSVRQRQVDYCRGIPDYSTHLLPITLRSMSVMAFGPIDGPSCIHSTAPGHYTQLLAHHSLQVAQLSA